MLLLYGFMTIISVSNTKCLYLDFLYIGRRLSNLVNKLGSFLLKE